MAHCPGLSIIGRPNIGLLFTTNPVVIWRFVSYCMEILFKFISKPALTIVSFRASLGPHLPPAVSLAMSAGKAFSLVEKVMSSAYREYTHLAFFAIRTSRMSSTCPIKLEIMGDTGLPCGSSLSWQAICAMTVATFGLSRKSLLFMKKP